MNALVLLSHPGYKVCLCREAFPTDGAEPSEFGRVTVAVRTSEDVNTLQTGVLIDHGANPFTFPKRRTTHRAGRGLRFGSLLPPNAPTVPGTLRTKQDREGTGEENEKNQQHTYTQCVDSVHLASVGRSAARSRVERLRMFTFFPTSSVNA